MESVFFTLLSKRPLKCLYFIQQLNLSLFDLGRVSTLLDEVLFFK